MNEERISLRKLFWLILGFLVLVLNWRSHGAPAGYRAPNPNDLVLILHHADFR